MLFWFVSVLAAVRKPRLGLHFALVVFSLVEFWLNIFFTVNAVIARELKKDEMFRKHTHSMRIRTFPKRENYRLEWIPVLLRAIDIIQRKMMGGNNVFKFARMRTRNEP